jgi:Effector Associated Constant Component 1
MSGCGRAAGASGTSGTSGDGASGDGASEPSAGREIWVRVTGTPTPDELRALAGWLDDDEQLRQLARLDLLPPGDPDGGPAAGGKPAGRGPAADGLLVTLSPAWPGAPGEAAPPPAAAALAAVVVAWVRGRGAEICVELTRPDGLTVRLEARTVRALPHAHVRGLTDHVAAMLAAGDPGSGQDARL